MCFAPWISISTAIVEFVLATALLVFFPRSSLKNFFAVFIYFLGFYQFSEFMLCTTGYAEFWATIGIITYSFLPALALHATIRVFNKKLSLFWIYLVPFLVIIFALLVPNFILSASCKRFFINIQSVMTLRDNLFHTLPHFLYVLYYFGFILASCWIIYSDFIKQKDPLKRKIELVELFGIFLMTAPTFILLIVFPSLKISFPSVLCEFAIFVSIAAFIGAYLESKSKKK